MEIEILLVAFQARSEGPNEEEMFEEGEESDENEIFLPDEQDTDYLEMEIEEEFFEEDE